MKLHTSLCKSIFLVAGIFYTVISSADVRLDLQASGDFPYVNYVNSASTVISNQITDDGSSASGYANLATGTLRAWTSSALGTGGASTSSQSVLRDDFSFSGPTGGTAYLDWVFNGSLSLNPNKPFSMQSGGGLSLYWVTPNSFGALQEFHALVNFGCTNMSVTSCLEGDSISLSGSIPIDVLLGDYHFQMGLSSWATEGDISDFGNSAHLSIRLPDGVSMNSRSGVFLSLAEPTSRVPEPSSLALLLLALAGLAKFRCKPVATN